MKAFGIRFGHVHPLCASPSAQPGWAQLQASSTVALASLQYWLQNLSSFGATQLQAGCAHLRLSGIDSVLDQPSIHRTALPSNSFQELTLRRRWEVLEHGLHGV